MSYDGDNAAPELSAPEHVEASLTQTQKVTIVELTQRWGDHIKTLPKPELELYYDLPGVVDRAADITIWNNLDVELQLLQTIVEEGTFDVKPPLVIPALGSGKNAAQIHMQDRSSRFGAKGKVLYATPDRRYTFAFSFGCPQKEENYAYAAPAFGRTYVAIGDYNRRGELTANFSVLAA